MLILIFRFLLYIKGLQKATKKYPCAFPFLGLTLTLIFQVYSSTLYLCAFSSKLCFAKAYIFQDCASHKIGA